ncbi:rhamnulokinase [Microbacterium telephonicum]|uniref:Rhamnulokinase n=1 Tax=Microbacterium telephonicum TaxID=1714841 RepID=A0A498CHE3_9MICO|nr:rhamnulokinase family protein [Microbacterium telephonicum]RLK52530.1 rhamnulokinase [Microbacterium telephonicum]
MIAASVVAVDLGATSGRVVLGHVDTNRLGLDLVHRFANTPVPVWDGLRWNILGLYGEVLTGIRDALSREPGARSIGVDSWAVDYALIRGDRVLGNPFHYRDTRTARGVDRVHARIPHSELYRRNGLQYLPFTTAYQLATEPQEMLGLADRMLLIPDLIGYWLTGRQRAEITNASTTGLLPLGADEWDRDLLERLGIPTHLTPPLIAPGETLGALAGDTAAHVGATGELPVVAVGSHDTASAVVAIPMTDPATAAYISCGTWGLVGLELERPVVTDTAREAGFTNERGVDGRTRFLHNVMGLWLLSESVRQWERESGRQVQLSELLACAALVPADRTAVFDVDDPAFAAPGDIPARIAAWYADRDLPAPASRPEFVRAIIESLADAFARGIAAAADLTGRTVATIHLVGGGSLNTLLCQRTAGRAGIPVIAGPVEATALGNVLIQARAIGAVPADADLESLRGLVAATQPQRQYLPQPQHARLTS